MHGHYSVSPKKPIRVCSDNSDYPLMTLGENLRKPCGYSQS